MYLSRQLFYEFRKYAVIPNMSVYSVVMVLLAVFTIAVAAQITIDIQPVPITLQTVAVMLIGLYYGVYDSFIVLGLYIICGVMGMPVFSGYASSAMVLIGPNGGYIVGMLLAAPMVSYIRLNVNLNVFVLTLLGQFVIYMFGISHLADIIGIKAALYSGFIVFIPSGIAKSVLLYLWCKK